ncbi:MAG: cardiolipin synthase ClsB [Gammaproteobacteria bacterium]|nr:cardiolipin synthase ClsB [Gammaproteobacteria bacterium]
MSDPAWRDSNKVELLINGETFFPSVFDAIRGAREEVLIETFILFEDKVGLELHEVLVDAGKRGVRINLMVDGYGSPDLSAQYLSELSAAGVQVQVFGARPKLLGMRTNLFRRLHRKLVVVDATDAWVGGINYSHDHLRDFGPEGKQDYAVKVRGPVVDDIRNFMLRAMAGKPARRWWRRRARWAPDPALPQSEGAQVLFVTRDNVNHRDDIEKHYRAVIRSANQEVMLANAYFFPGYRVLREFRNAARRGVRVRLILQGQPDKKIMRWAAMSLYDYLLRAGVEIYEYVERPLHAKIALADEEWSTVGSSNLDPLSLALNLEANLMIRDRSFNAGLREHMECLIDEHCQRIVSEHAHRPLIWQRVVTFFVFHFLRHFPAWAGWFPAHAGKLTKIEPLRSEAPDWPGANGNVALSPREK